MRFNFREKQDEVFKLESQIRQKAALQKKAGIELDSTCQICLRTKFADGVGHTCNYCNVRCCAKCGGKVTLRSAKIIWVCILCRKKQELMIKTGGWMHASQHPSHDEDDPILRQMEADLRSPGTAAAAFNTAPPLSASLHAPHPYEQRQRQQPHHAGSGSGLTSLFSRAMSLAGTPSHPSGGPASGVGGGIAGASGEAPGFFGFSSSAASTPTHTPTGSSSGGIRGRFERVASLDRPSGTYGGSGSFLSPSPRPLSHQRHAPSLPGGTAYAAYGGRGPSGRARMQLPRQRSLESSESLSPAGPPQMSRLSMGTSAGAGSGTLTRGVSEGLRNDPPPTSSYHPQGGATVRRRGILTRGMSMGSSAPAFPNSASFHTGPVSAHLSTSFGRNMGSSGYLGGPRDRVHLETASAPEDVVELPHGHGHDYLGHDSVSGGRREVGSLYPRVLVSDSEARDLCPPMLDTKAHSDHGASTGVISGTRTRTARRKLDATFRNDSLSSDQSECVQRPHPPRPHKSKRRLPSTTGMRQTGRAAATVAAAATTSRTPDGSTAGAGGRRKRGTGGSSFASSSEDDEVRSTPDYTSCGEEMESESISEKGKRFPHFQPKLSTFNSLPSAGKVAFKAVEILA